MYEQQLTDILCGDMYYISPKSQVPSWASAIKIQEKQTWGWDTCANVIQLSSLLILLEIFPKRQQRPKQPLLTLSVTSANLWKHQSGWDCSCSYQNPREGSAPPQALLVTQHRDIHPGDRFPPTAFSLCGWALAEAPFSKVPHLGRHPNRFSYFFFSIKAEEVVASQGFCELLSHCLCTERNIDLHLLKSKLQSQQPGWIIKTHTFALRQ